MKVNVHVGAESAGEAAATDVLSVLAAVGAPVLGLATGDSPLALYAALRRRVEAGLDLSDVAAFALDEYVGLPAGHPQSYRSVIGHEVTRPLRLTPSRVHVPDGSADDLEAAADRFEAAIQASGGVDVQIVGLGRNGHLAFNEPGSPWSSRTRVVRLTDDTRHANARFFSSLDEVPTHAVTQGLETIMSARHIVLMAHGRSKADAVRRIVEGPVDPACPGSVLQRHPSVELFVDEDAAALLDR